MKKTPILLLFLVSLFNCYGQFADQGTGSLRNDIWWLNWNGATITNGYSQTFTTASGLSLTVTFSGVSNPPLPNVMNTWSGAVLWNLYNFSSPSIKPALYNNNSSSNSLFSFNISASRNGIATPFKLVAADAEASTINNEVTTLVSNGSVWKAIDFVRTSGCPVSDPLVGCNTQSVEIINTYGGSPGVGQSPVVATESLPDGTLNIQVTLDKNGVFGGMAVALGILESADAGDLPAGYGYAEHALNYVYSNECNYNPPFPVLTPVQPLYIGNIPGDADPLQNSDDNLTGVADEDAVSAFPQYTGSGSYSITMNLTNTTGTNAYLTGWFDSNRDGIFSASEAVTNVIPANASSSTLVWNGLPPNLQTGTVNDFGFRFRISTVSQANNPSGYAPDGEVEDYLINSPQILSTDSIVINNYTPVLGLAPCNNTIIVKDATGFNAGDTVLMIQMKGAIIDSTNTLSFGTITDYRNAGNYEFNYIKSVSGNNIELLNTITRQYNIPDGKVQLVRVPYYIDYTVSNPLTCLPWDGEKGGVLAFNVQNTLTLAQNIDVSGRGFNRGSSPNTNNNNWSCNSSAYFYPAFSIEGAEKGEGISEISNNKINGKGALANGGGGGNQSNSGGGGGSNIGAGGTGGNQFQFCSGVDGRGLGGKPLNPISQNKVFMGGGGGSGDANNPPPNSFSSFGGNGGGIVLISANQITAVSPEKIIANGNPGLDCNTGNCHEGMGGGGAGGSILLNINSYSTSTNLSIEANGGKGADAIHLPSASPYKHGPGGGGGGGLIWLSNSSNPSNVVTNINGGLSGVNINFNNDPWGAAAGQQGSLSLNLNIPYSTPLFVKNIDSVRINDSVLSCSSFDFTGIAYTNNSPVNNWHWDFGDGTFANSQSTTHSYTTTGNYTIKLVATDINGCKDSVMININAVFINPDFTFVQNICNPMSVQFNGTGTAAGNPYWLFGDGNSNNGSVSPINIYSSYGDYTVKYALQSASCTDTVTKIITIAINDENIIQTNDTTICLGTTKQLRSIPALNYCWSPATYLNDPSVENPVTSTPESITYYLTSQTQGNNLVNNGDFSQGNTGFSSDYISASSNTTEAQYFVANDPHLWNVNLNSCIEHTTGTGKMMMINGSSLNGAKVWYQTITVLPNTNYAFSVWVESLAALNPANLRFSINNNIIGNNIQAGSVACQWSNFYTVWNSGSNTTAFISIVNNNTIADGNDFALDDISFSAISLKRDSVRIVVDSPVVRTSNDTAICEGGSIQLTTTGAQTYIWSPGAGLSNTSIPDPVASPVTNTQYVVTGTDNAGCTANDSVSIIVHSLPVITISADTTICPNTSITLFASGGTTYSWTPSGTLNNPSVFNPIATPLANTTYYLSVTDANNCSNNDSITVSIYPDPVFSISPSLSTCLNAPVQLAASGGDIYSWQPSSGLNDIATANPVATPSVTTTYTVNITESTCNRSTQLSTVVTIFPLPSVAATRQNDIDCSNNESRLNATGANTYTWSPAATLNDPNSQSPIAKPITTTLYTVTGTDINGCSNTDTVSVKVTSTNKGGYEMPSAFTPNGDGLNDCYGIKYWGVIQNLDFSIYNRWGQRVFHTNNPDACWDGTFKGEKQSAGVFVYIIKASTMCDKEVFRKGTLILIR